MNKKIVLKNNSILMFIVNIAIIFSIFIFKNILNTTYIASVLCNLILLLDFIVLCAGIYFNIKLINKPNLYNVKKSCMIILLCFIYYILINVGIIFISDKIIEQKYSNITSRLLKYCESFTCERYETKINGKHMDFVIKNTYFDYDNIENSYEIHNLFNSKDIISIEAIIYSDKNSFSENFISKLVEDYFINFDIYIEPEAILNAFDNRFDNKFIIYKNISYKVTEIYKKNNLEKIKTQIIVNINT